MHRDVLYESPCLCLFLGRPVPGWFEVTVTEGLWSTKVRKTNTTSTAGLTVLGLLAVNACSMLLRSDQLVYSVRSYVPDGLSGP